MSRLLRKLALPRLHAGVALLAAMLLCPLLIFSIQAGAVIPPPNTVITGGPTDGSFQNSGSAAFTYTTDPPELGATFECRRYAGSKDPANPTAFSSCPAAGQSYPNLGDGRYTFEVRARGTLSGIDPSDVDQSPAGSTWTVDTTRPGAPQIQNEPFNPSNSPAANFVYIAEASATVQCRLDDAVFADCPAGGQTYNGLADGGHNFYLRARDLAGNIGSETIVNWRIDTQRPETTIDVGPDQRTSADRASLGFHASESASFQCRLDGGGWGGCTSPAAYRNLSAAQHSFAVRAIDNAGNIDQSPASRAWTVLEGGRATRERHHRRKPSRVFVVVMENKEYGKVVGRRGAPYTRWLARHYASAARFYAVAHPSLPNYLAMLAGSTFGINSGCTDCDNIDARTLVDQLEANGISWRAYMEGMPGACYRGAEYGRYVKRHNPFMYFRGVASGRSCKNILPGKRLSRDLRRNNLTSLNWITPDQCHNTHSCSIRKGDRYLRSLIPRLLRHVGRHGFVVLTYDEGTSNQRGGGRIPTIFAGPDVRRSARISRRYSTYSLLKTLERFFSVGFLREASLGHTRSMSDMFRGRWIRQSSAARR